MKERRYDIDWLRVIATLTIFLFHCARFFDTIDWHLKNSEKSDLATTFVVLLSLWSMPLFFVLSGIGSWYALETRTGGVYLFDRVKRLLIPLYTVGIFLLLPPQYYIDQITHRAYAPNIWYFIPPYFEGSSFKFILEAPYLTNIWPGHLWFLQFLFLISLFTLPFLLYFKSESGRNLIKKMADWCDRWGGIYLYVIPLLLVPIGLRRLSGGEYPHNWIIFIEYALFFLIGYLYAADKRFTESVQKHTWVGLVLGIAGFAFIAITYMNLGYNPLDGNTYNFTFLITQIAWTVASWSWIVFLLGIGAKYLNFNNRFLAYANQAVLPFYILHQTVILAVGWFVIPLELPIMVKYLMISIGSFIIIIALYELLIRRFNVLRFLFGMRVKKKSSKEPAIQKTV